MKKIILIMVSMVMSLSLFAQKDVTTFLGIPVDGTKQQMKEKLVAKGFVPKRDGVNEFLDGEFNGEDVHIYIGTNSNKVYRVMVCDANTRTEGDIKTRFNRLVSQFENNKRYKSLSDNQSIDDDVDISYEMLVNNKSFEAIFFQKPNIENIDTLSLLKEIQSDLLENHTEEQVLHPDDNMKTELINYILKKSINVFMKKIVWFKIHQYRNEYYIAIMYDNEYNHANGEDL